MANDLSKYVYRPGSNWFSSQEICDSLKGDGWSTSDTYGNSWRPLPDGPGIYVILLHTRIKPFDAIVAYVGMSTCLENRLSRPHEVKDTLWSDDHWPMVWWKSCENVSARDCERHYIHTFDPPYNLIGRRRGLQDA